MLNLSSLLTMFSKYSRISERIADFGKSKDSATETCLYLRLVRLGDPYFDHDCSPHSSLSTKASEFKAQHFPKKKSGYLPMMKPSYIDDFRARLNNEYEMVVSEVQEIIKIFWPETKKEDPTKETKYKRMKSEVAAGLLSLIQVEVDDGVPANKQMYQYTLSGLLQEKEITFEELLIECWAYVVRDVTRVYVGNVEELVDCCFSTPHAIKLKIFSWPDKVEVAGNEAETSSVLEPVQSTTQTANIGFIIHGAVYGGTFVNGNYYGGCKIDEE